jgi:hypothetical protein
LLKVFAWISLVAAFVCGLFIAVDESMRPQKMAVMNVIWPNERVAAAASGLKGAMSLEVQPRFSQARSIEASTASANCVVPQVPPTSRVRHLRSV